MSYIRYNEIELYINRSNVQRRHVMSNDGVDYNYTAWTIFVDGNVSPGATRYTEGGDPNWPPDEGWGIPDWGYDFAQPPVNKYDARKPVANVDGRNRYMPAATDRAIRQRLSTPRRKFEWSLHSLFQGAPENPNDPKNYSSTIIEVWPAQYFHEQYGFDDAGQPDPNNEPDRPDRYDQYRWADVWLGPKPQVHDIQKIEGEAWFRVQFSVEFYIRECPIERTSEASAWPAWLEHRFQQYATIGEDHLEQRVTEGYVRFNRFWLQTLGAGGGAVGWTPPPAAGQPGPARATDPRIVTLADQVRPSLRHPIPPFMKRTDIKIHQTFDPTVYKYTFVDKEQSYNLGQTAQSAGVLKIEAIHQETQTYSTPNPQFNIPFTNIAVGGQPSQTVIGWVLERLRGGGGLIPAAMVAPVAAAARTALSTFVTSLAVTVHGRPTSNKRSLMNIGIAIMTGRLMEGGILDRQGLARDTRITWDLHQKKVFLTAEYKHTGSSNGHQGFPALGKIIQGSTFPNYSDTDEVPLFDMAGKPTGALALSHNPDTRNPELELAGVTGRVERHLLAQIVGEDCSKATGPPASLPTWNTSRPHDMQRISYQ